MNEHRSGSAEPNRKSRLRVFWEDHKFMVILVSCLVLPVVFVPVWIIAFLVGRIRNALGQSSKYLPPDEPIDVADILEHSLVEHTIMADKVEHKVSSVGVFLHGFILVVGVMLCVLGWQVIGLASGQPGGGLALLMGYGLFAGGAICAIIGVVGSAKGFSRERH